MTATLVYERINNNNYTSPLEELKLTYGKSYYKYYQLKLRQLLITNRYRQEYERKYSKQKTNEKRSFKEYMNHLQEKIKAQSLNDDDSRRRASSVVGITNRRTKDCVTFTITSTEISSTANTILPTETRPKPILKTRQTSFFTKRQRVTSAPANSQRNLNKRNRIKIPTIKINDDDDDNLSKSNGCSYTQASSSSQDHIYKNNHYARQSVLNTIISHLHSNTSADISKWNLYREFNDKFSASISPKVYRNFERIIL